MISVSDNDDLHSNLELVCWCIWGYKAAFGIYMLPFVGRPGPILTTEMLIEQSDLPSAGVVQYFPLSTMAYFQFVRKPMGSDRVTRTTCLSGEGLICLS